MLLAPPLYRSCYLSENTNIRGGWEGLITHRLTSPSSSPFDEHHRSQTNGVQGGEPKARPNEYHDILSYSLFDYSRLLFPRSSYPAYSLPVSIFSRSSYPAYSSPVSIFSRSSYPVYSSPVSIFFRSSYPAYSLPASAFKLLHATRSLEPR